MRDGRRGTALVLGFLLVGLHAEPAAADIIIGDEGDNTLIGSEASDLIQGLGGDDALYGLGGEIDQLIGGAGDDVLDGGPGTDLLQGGSDDDTLLSGDGFNSTLQGEAGNDVLFGGPDNDSLEGGDGNDTVVGGGGNDSVEGGAGADVLAGGAGSDVVDTGPGGDLVVVGQSDTATGSTDSDTYVLSEADGPAIAITVSDPGGVDMLRSALTTGTAMTVALAGGVTTFTNAAGAPATLTLTDPLDAYEGGPNPETVLGSDGADRIATGAGDDTVHGLGGDDTIETGDGADLLQRLAGIDALTLGAGADRVEYGVGAGGFLAGDDGGDTIVADAADRIRYLGTAALGVLAVRRAGASWQLFDVATGAPRGAPVTIFGTDDVALCSSDGTLCDTDADGIPDPVDTGEVAPTGGALACDAADAAPFTDIGSSFAAEEVRCLYTAGLVSGTSPTTFGPAQVVTREQMAVFLMAAYENATGGAYGGPSGGAGFTDIAASYAATRIRQLAGLGVTAGASPTRYDPAGVVTREQMAVFLMRVYETLHGPFTTTFDPGFVDTAGSFAAVEIDELAALGVTAGVAPSVFAPTAPVSREQMAVFLVALLSG